MDIGVSVYCICTHYNSFLLLLLLLGFLLFIYVTPQRDCTIAREYIQYNITHREVVLQLLGVFRKIRS
jgi:hypothetical protein